ncbi:SAM-dependent methyltransferase [Actinophytocola sediminis]
MTEAEFDFAGTFGADYLHFYAEALNDETSDAQTELIATVAGLEPGAEVLDLACGHGRIANRLAARGCAVTGLDASPLFLDRARADAGALGVEVDFRLGDMRELAWTARFDVVVNWFTAFGYFDDDGNRRVLTEVARALRPGGRFVVELNHLPWLLRNFRPSSVLELDGDLLIDRNTFDPLTNRVSVDRVTIRDGVRRNTRFFTRLYAVAELRALLHTAGFAEVTAFGEGGTPLTMDSRRLIVVATR